MTTRWRQTTFSAGRRLYDGLRPLLPDYLPVAWKLGLTFSLLILLGMAVLSVLLLNAQSTTLQTQADNFGRTLAAQLADSAREPLLADDPLALNVLVNELASSDNLVGAALFDRDLRLSYSAGRLPAEAVPTLSGPVRHWREGGDPLTTYFAVIRAAEATAGYAAVTLSGATIVAAQTSAKRTLITATLLMSLIAVAAALVVSRRLARPLTDLVAATTAMRAGDLNVRIKGRSNDEIGQLVEAYNNMAHGLLEKDQVERVLSRFVSPRVAARMMADIGEVQLGGREVNATVLFADIVGFTQLSENMAPEAVAELLNDYFNAISTAANFYRGTIDKFMGDCAMLVFGVPEDDSEHLYHGLCCAVMIQRLVGRVNEARCARGLPGAEFRVGINAGTMLAGNLGSEDRMQYTVVGDAVNLASRLSQIAAPGEIIIPDHLVDDANVASRLRTRPAGTMRLRGKSAPVLTYRVEGVHTHSEILMERRIGHFLNDYVSARSARVGHA